MMANPPRNPDSPLHSSSNLNDGSSKQKTLLNSLPPWATSPAHNTYLPKNINEHILERPVPDERFAYDVKKGSGGPTFISISPIRPFEIEGGQSSLSYRSTTPIQDDDEHLPFASPIPYRLSARIYESDDCTSFQTWRPPSPQSQPVIWGSEVDVQIIPNMTIPQRPPQTPPHTVFDSLPLPQTTYQHVQTMPLPYYDFPERDSLSPEYLYGPPQDVDDFEYSTENHEILLEQDYDWELDAEVRLLATHEEEGHSFDHPDCLKREAEQDWEDNDADDEGC